MLERAPEYEFMFFIINRQLRLGRDPRYCAFDTKEAVGVILEESA